MTDSELKPVTASTDTAHARLMALDHYALPTDVRLVVQTACVMAGALRRGAHDLRVRGGKLACDEATRLEADADAIAWRAERNTMHTLRRRAQ